MFAQRSEVVSEFESQMDQTQWCNLYISLKYEQIYNFPHNTMHMYSGITSGRVLDGQLLYTMILDAHMYSGITSGRVLNGELLYTKILGIHMYSGITSG